MADIATVWRGFAGDLVVAGPSLLNDDGLQTAVVHSLFTDRLADVDDVLPSASASRRGWWGDAFAEREGDLLGSRLWLLQREKQTTQVLRRAEEHALEALQWLLDDGIARAVDVQALLLQGDAGQGVLGLSVAVTRSTRPVERYRFEAFWKGA